MNDKIHESPSSEGRAAVLAQVQRLACDCSDPAYHLTGSAPCGISRLLALLALGEATTAPQEEWGSKSGVLIWGPDGKHTEVEHPHAGIWLELLDHPTTDECPDAECMACGMRDCPDQEPLHYHHDGCPSCYLAGRYDAQPLSVLPALQGAQPSPSDAPIRALIEKVEVLADVAACDHKDRAGGNDYLCCNVCYHMWDYRRETPGQRLAASLKLLIPDLEALLPARQGAE